jgi:hypothetical protein
MRKSEITGAMVFELRRDFSEPYICILAVAALGYPRDQAVFDTVCSNYVFKHRRNNRAPSFVNDKRRAPII